MSEEEVQKDLEDKARKRTGCAIQMWTVLGAILIVPWIYAETGFRTAGGAFLVLCFLYQYGKTSARGESGISMK